MPAFYDRLRAKPDCDVGPGSPVDREAAGHAEAAVSAEAVGSVEGEAAARERTAFARDAVLAIAALLATAFAIWRFGFERVFTPGWWRP